MPKRRDYKDEYARYHGKPEQIKNRAQRNAARKAYEKKFGNLPASVDVDHKRSIDKKGGNKLGNLRALSRKKNRGYARDANNNPRN